MATYGSGRAPTHPSRYGPLFSADLHDDFTDPFTHWTLQNLVAIFCDPHDVKSVVKSRLNGFRIEYDFLS